MGKGSGRRPMTIERLKFDENWERIFRKLEEHFDEKDGADGEAGDTTGPRPDGDGGTTRDDVAPDVQ